MAQQKMAQDKSALIVGASRGLGLAIVQELLRRGWAVTATVRGTNTALHALGAGPQLQIEQLDITAPEQIAALRQNLQHRQDRQFDLLFVNAGVTNDRHETIGEVSTEDFTRVLVTNALAPMRVVEQFAGTVRPGGTVGVMSSGQGSVADNERGEFEVYRASKAALNTLMRSYAARSGEQHALLLLAPGWIQTDMGGAAAKFTVEETIGDIVDTITGQEGRKGLRYLDRFGEAVRW